MKLTLHPLSRRALLSGLGAAVLPAVLLASLPAEAQRGTRVRLGSRTVDGRRDRDTIEVNQRGRFRALEFRIRSNPARIHDVVVHFENGTRLRAALRRGIFTGSYRRYHLDLPGNRRNVDRVTFRYSNLGGRREAEVILYGIR